MKMPMMRTKVQRFVAVILTAGLFAAWANAQSAYRGLTFSGKFTLSHEVNWGNTMLPAREYSININSSKAPALVRSKGGKTTVLMPIPIGDDSRKNPSALFIAARGKERQVLSLNLPELGKSLVYKRLTQAEREMTAGVEQVQVVPAIRRPHLRSSVTSSSATTGHSSWRGHPLSFQEGNRANLSPQLLTYLVISM